MPPKNQKFQEPESSSEEGDEGMDGRGMDFTRFTNPNYSREFMATLPAKIRDRTKALLALDAELTARRNAKEIAVDELKRKYEALFAPLYERRREIVIGLGEPATAAEIAAGVPEDHKGKVSVELDNSKDEETGLEGFWLTALQHHVVIESMITDRDEEVLENLIDISCGTLDPKERPGFSVVFTFKPNEFFQETKLFKIFYWKLECGETTIDDTSESPITWAEGKDVTVITTTQKQKSKSKKGAVRYVTKTEPCDSFFNLFKHAEDPEENEQWCSLAITIRDKVCPLAIEYYTGEAPDGSSDYDDDDEYEEGEEEEEEEEEEEAPPPKKGGAPPSAGRGGKTAAAPPAKAGGKQPECKQQ
jgi:nucleosome assembly protein 1-like 1